VWATVLDVAKGISVFSMTLSSLSYNQNSGGWQSLSTDALPAGLYRLEFGASAADLGGGVGDASLYVDNVRLEPVVIPGDLNSDDSVDAMDAGIMFANWTGDPSLAGHGPMSLPEPSTAMLLSMLWPCIAMRRR